MGRYLSEFESMVESILREYDGVVNPSVLRNVDVLNKYLLLAYESIRYLEELVEKHADPYSLVSTALEYYAFIDSKFVDAVSAELEGVENKYLYRLVLFRINDAHRNIFKKLLVEAIAKKTME